MTERVADQSESVTSAGVPPGRVAVFLRPIGAPLTLGFFGLAGATFVLSGLQVGWVATSESNKVALTLIGFAAVAQSLAAIFGFLARDGVAATAMAVLALVWLVVGLNLYVSQPGATSAALGLFLLFGGAAVGLSGVTAMLSKIVPAVVLLVAATRFVVTGIYELSGRAGWGYASGVIGLVLFVLALYAAWATELEDAQGRTVLPLGRRRKGKVALQGDLAEQSRHVSSEPGVRTQL